MGNNSSAPQPPSPTDSSYKFELAGGLLPYAKGAYAIGCVEVDVRVSKKTDGDEVADVDVVPCHVFYPVLPSRALEGRELPAWLTTETAAALGRAQLAEVFSAPVAVALMTMLGPAATGFLKLPAPIGAPPAPAPANGWPTCVFAHSLTAWALHQSAAILSIASHGAVVACPTHCDRH